jgi:alpha-glucosidase (family GH31 glycosyl hydrolase)
MQIGDVVGWQMVDGEAVIRTAVATVGVSFAAPDIARVRVAQGERLISEESFVLAAEPTRIPLRVDDKGDRLELRTDACSVHVTKKPLGVSVRDASGRERVATPVLGLGDVDGTRTTLRLVLRPGERIYGLGQDPMANLDQRGHERRMWNEWGGFGRSGNNGIAFYSSTQGYGLLLASPWPARFAIGQAEVALPGPCPTWAVAPWPWTEHSGERDPDRLAIVLDHGMMDVFFVCRSGLDAIQRAYADLTGHATLLPKWAYGFIQCKNRYRSAEELLSLGRELRRREIPCDCLVIDWLWFKEFGDLDWDPLAWPDPSGTFAELAKMGFHVMQAQHPFIDKGSRLFEAFREKGYLLANAEDGGATSVDHSNPEARAAWWSEVKKLYQQGIRAYWTDMGELEKHPAGTSHIGPRERVHNVYTLLWTKGLYEGQRAGGGERVFSLARAACAGVQRHGAALWSNDIESSWNVLRDQVVIGQGVALSGQPWWCTDIGGFMMHADFSPELYVRWFEWGTFCPLFRTHGTRPENEPWAYGPEIETILTAFIRLRYRILPYIYSCAAAAHAEGRPMMRAMVMDYTDDPAAIGATNQFMFGPALLVAPVTDPGARSRRVWLPAGDWYDFWTGARIRGGRTIEAAAPLERIPIYVRAGSVVPMGPVVRHALEPTSAPMEVHTYAGAAGAFELYDDDGLSYAYEKGACARTTLRSDADGRLSVDAPRGDGSVVPSDRSYREVRHDGSDHVPAVRTFVDWDLAQDGRITAHATVVNDGASAPAVVAAIEPPPGWRLLRSTGQVWGPQDRIETQLSASGLTHLVWTYEPTGWARPLAPKASLTVRIGEQTVTTPMVWGSRWATRMRWIGNFDNEDGKALDRPFSPEQWPSEPSYEVNGKTVAWSLSPNDNCFGYFGSWPGAGSGKACAYARFRVFSAEARTAYVELATDSATRIWIGKREVLRTDDFTLKHVEPTSIALPKGYTDVLFKCAVHRSRPYSGRELGLYVRFVDEAGRPVDELLYEP